MSASILDPRMIDPSKPLQISQTNITSLTSTLITTPSGNSDTWNAVSTIVRANSASWEESADITAVTTTVQSNSANWNFGYDVATYVQSNSSTWEESADVTVLSTIIESNSANWNSAYATTTALSSNLWNDVYTTVQINSANWEESADILPTVTNYLSTNNITLSTLFVTSLTALTAQFDQTIYTLTTSESISAANINATSQLLSAGVDLFNIFLTTETDSQTLIFNESTNQLTILSGNTVSLSSLSDTTIINSVSGLLTPLTVYQNASANWQSTYETVCALSASWEESANILPTVTNYLSTELVTVSSLNVTQQLLSGNSNLFNLFLTPANTLTTSVCSISGDGITPFVMNFTNGLLTSITF